MSRRSDLKDSVSVKDNGDTVIGGVPMVDQGRKGYCAVASAERVFRYYGLQVDQHAMAQIAQSSSRLGTNSALAPTSWFDAHPLTTADLQDEAKHIASTGVELTVAVLGGGE